MYFTGPVTADLQTLRLCVEYQFPTFISRNTLASNPGLPALVKINTIACCSIRLMHRLVLVMYCTIN